MSVLGVTEVQWKGEGEIRNEIVWFIYSGGERLKEVHTYLHTYLCTTVHVPLSVAQRR